MFQVLQRALALSRVKYPSVGLWMMVGGMPNVGKSTLLNQLRHKLAFEGHNRTRAASVAPLPCTTRNVQGFKVAENPLAYLIDTPGICVPKISNDETALKLSLIGCVDDKIPGKEVVLEYMLFQLNRNNNRKYLERYRLERPCESVEELIMAVRNKYH